MKAILIILVVALGGLTYKYQLDAKASRLKMIEAEAAMSDANDALASTKKDLSKANERIEQLRSDATAHAETIKLLKKELTDIGRAVPATVEAAQAQASPVATAPTVSLDERLKTIEDIYNKNLAEIRSQRDLLTVNRSKAESIKNDLEANRPEFIEQRTRTNNDLSTSTVGVRMSQADRNEILEKHQAKLDQMTAQISAIDQELVNLRSREKALDDAYVAARRKAQEEVSK